MRCNALTTFHHANICATSNTNRNMENPFQIISSRLTNIESLLIETIAKLEAKETKKKKRIVDTQQLSETIDETSVTIQRWRNSGKIPYFQVGEDVRYDLDAVLEALSKKKGGKKC